MIANLLRRHGGTLPTWLVRWSAALYGPFLGAGIRITRLDPDYRYMRVEMPLTFYNRNYVGTQFGGGMYAMTDPFYMMMLIRNLSGEYIVWDKAATIEFVKPGRRRLIVEFRWSEQELQEIRRATEGGRKHFVEKEALIHDDQGTLIARVIKTLYVRRKDLASTG